MRAASPVRARAGILCAALVLSSCSSWFGPNTDPTTIVADVDVDKGVNPEPGNVPHPIVLRFSVLTSKDTFTTSDFNALYTRDKQVLAADLVSTEEMELRPGETRTIKVDDAKLGTLVGAFAAFYDIDNAKWRDTWPIVPHEANKLVVHVGVGSVSIGKKPSPGWSLWPF